MTKELIPAEIVSEKIFVLRGQKVMFDSDLAKLFGTTTSRLNEQVKRNRHRFPDDFMFQLSQDELEEAAILRSKGGRRYKPYVFTEHGTVMLATVLNTPRAIQASVDIVRTFIRMREMIMSHKDLFKRLDDLERKYDAQFKVVFNSIRQLIEAKPKEILEQQKKRKIIGFGRE